MPLKVYTCCSKIESNFSKVGNLEAKKETVSLDWLNETFSQSSARVAEREDSPEYFLSAVSEEIWSAVCFNIVGFKSFYFILFF